jgi:hypothetical protein
MTRGQALELAKLLDGTVAILREHLGEKATDLEAVMAHFLTETGEFRINVWPSWPDKYCWQGRDAAGLLESLRGDVWRVQGSILLNWMHRIEMGDE